LVSPDPIGNSHELKAIARTDQDPNPSCDLLDEPSGCTPRIDPEAHMAEQKVAIVTGAGTGIGKAVALALAKDGYAVVLAGRRAEKLDETKKEAGNAKTLSVPTDVSDPESIKALFARTKKEFGRLDLLFNNAGNAAPAVTMEELPLETWKKVVDTNLTGMFVCTQEAIKIMKAQNPKGGRIVNNGSISAHTPRPRAAAYTATKHAVTGLTKQTALDCRNDNILCSQIDFGNAATPLTDRMVQGQGVLQPDGTMMQEARMNADDVGRAVVYIANLPLDTNVLFMTVMANGMPFVGRG
jgi:NADP-dependent 3-hydroxy acid dehydrogenase YdfG